MGDPGFRDLLGVTMGVAILLSLQPQQRQRQGEAERLGGPEIDNELDFCKQLDRQVGGLLPLK